MPLSSFLRASYIVVRSTVYDDIMEKKKPKRRIFVVDDDVSIREILSLMVRDAGYSVESFSSGKEMMQVLEKKIPTVILLDYFLPGEVTDDLISQVNEKSKETSIILMSADIRTSKISEHLPVKAFLQKPFQMDTVLSMLSSYA